MWLYSRSLQTPNSHLPKSVEQSSSSNRAPTPPVAVRPFVVDPIFQPSTPSMASLFSPTFGNPALERWSRRVSQQECHYPRLRTCGMDGGWSRTQVRSLLCMKWYPSICLTAFQSTVPLESLIPPSEFSTPISPSKALAPPSNHRHLAPPIRTCSHHRSKLALQTCASSLPIALTSA